MGLENALAPMKGDVCMYNDMMVTYHGMLFAYKYHSLQNDSPLCLACNINLLKRKAVSIFIRYYLGAGI